MLFTKTYFKQVLIVYKTIVCWPTPHRKLETPFQSGPRWPADSRSNMAAAVMDLVIPKVQSKPMSCLGHSLERSTLHLHWNLSPCEFHPLGLSLTNKGLPKTSLLPVPHSSPLNIWRKLPMSPNLATRLIHVLYSFIIFRSLTMSLSLYMLSLVLIKLHQVSSLPQLYRGTWAIRLKRHKEQSA